MNTIIIENADNETTATFTQMAKKLGLSVHTKAEKEQGGIMNPELLRRIERIENGEAELVSTSIDELRQML